MEMNQNAFLEEEAKIKQLPEEEQKAYYARWLEIHTEKTTAYVSASLRYAAILYREGAFRDVMEVLMPIALNYTAYPYSEDLISCMNQMGLAVNCESEYKLACKFFGIALQIAEEHNVISFYAKQHNNMGLTYHDRGEYDEALREYEQGEPWVEVSDPKNIIGAMLYDNWANVLVEQKRWKEALEKYRKALEYAADEVEDPLDLGLIIYYKLGETEKFEAAKQKFLTTIKDDPLDPEEEIYLMSFYYRLLKDDIGAEDEAFTAEIYRQLEAYVKAHPGVDCWKAKAQFADLVYAKAEKEGDTATMLEMLRCKTNFQSKGAEQLEKRRWDALSEYIDLSREKQKAIERAEKAALAKSQFLASMSHDIRTPMNAIYGLAQLMEHDKGDNDKMDDHISKLKASSKHLLSLINDVLDMSKIESSEVELNHENINLCEQVAQLRSIVCPQTDDKEQNFTVRLHGIRHEYLMGDAVRLRQILINLLSNAIKYTPRGGSIVFDLTEKPGQDDTYAMYEFAVRDTGFGMSQEFMQHIFEPFTRAESSLTNKVQGTGLGMAITKNIVDLMGGTIAVESELGKGSCFTVTIPLEIDTQTVLTIPFEHILMIAQEEDLIENFLAAFHGAQFRLQVCRSLEEGEALLTANPADVILLASHCTQSRLADAVARLKSAAPDAELVFCTDYDQPELTSKVLESCGITKVMARPIFLTDLLAVFGQIAQNMPKPAKDVETVLRGKKFLCAEDNALNAEILEAILEIEGASCTILTDGKKIADRFETLKPGEYDAILMDMQMPVMNGLEATRAIRRSSNPLGKTIPIIAMTANAFSSDVQDCLNAGMDAHMSKPLDVKILKQTVSSVLEYCSRGGGTSVRKSRTQLKAAYPLNHKHGQV